MRFIHVAGWTVNHKAASHVVSSVRNLVFRLDFLHDWLLDILCRALGFVIVFQWLLEHHGFPISVDRFDIASVLVDGSQNFSISASSIIFLCGCDHGGCVFQFISLGLTEESRAETLLFIRPPAVCSLEFNSSFDFLVFILRVLLFAAGLNRLVKSRFDLSKRLGRSLGGGLFLSVQTICLFLVVFLLFLDSIKLFLGQQHRLINLQLSAVHGSLLLELSVDLHFIALLDHLSAMRHVFGIS